MKTIIRLSLLLMLLISSVVCNAQKSKKANLTKPVSSKVDVYYFHFTQRCKTCHAVEDNAKSAVESLYPEQVKNGNYSFKSLNLDDANSQALAKKLNVGGQTLLVVTGNKKTDITSQGFMYAQEPTKIKEEIKKAVNGLLTR